MADIAVLQQGAVRNVCVGQETIGLIGRLDASATHGSSLSHPVNRRFHAFAIDLAMKC
jgi:hypothetical protein